LKKPKKALFQRCSFERVSRPMPETGKGRERTGLKKGGLLSQLRRHDRDGGMLICKRVVRLRKKRERLVGKKKPTVVEAIGRRW